MTDPKDQRITELERAFAQELQGLSAVKARGELKQALKKAQEAERETLDRITGAMDGDFSVSLVGNIIRKRLAALRGTPESKQAEVLGLKEAHQESNPTRQN